jgi:NDP-sugar pyrophosphorylase family protein
MNTIPQIGSAILAGGLGTRLRSVVDDRPKVLAEVAGRPFLTYLLDQLVAARVHQTVLLTGYRGQQIEDLLGDCYRGMKLLYSRESQPLGTGGALRGILTRLDTPTVLLLNGDSYCAVEIAAFARFHACLASQITLALARVPDTSAFGRVRLGRHDQIVEFEEKGKTTLPGWINAGVYLVQQDVIHSIPTHQAVSLERDVLPVWVARGKVFGYRQEGPFIDIGTPESLTRAAELVV